MKKQTLEKKLVLNKETLASLTLNEMEIPRGGGTYTCPGLNCPSLAVDCN